MSGETTIRNWLHFASATLLKPPAPRNALMPDQFDAVHKTGTPPPIEDTLDSENGDTPWAVTLSIERPPLPRVRRIAEAATTRPYAPSPCQALCFRYRSELGPSHSSRTLLVLELKSMGKGSSGSLITRSCRRLLRLLGRRILRVWCISVRYARWKNFESSMHEIRSVCSVFIRRAPEFVLNLAKLSLGWLCELLEQRMRAAKTPSSLEVGSG